MIPDAFKAAHIFPITPVNSVLGKCSIEEHAQIPSYISFSSKSSKSICPTFIPVYSAASLQSSFEPSTAFT